MNNPAEAHVKLSPSVRDVIIGMSDGLTVPFAIAAGLASAGAGAHSIIITAVLSEIAAGSISMGLGGFLAAQTEAEHYAAEFRRENREVEEMPEAEEKEVTDIFRLWGLSAEESGYVMASLKRRKEDWVKFMMRFELELQEPDRARAIKSAFTIGGAYIVGGFIPLAPYFFSLPVWDAFLTSAAVTALALIVFGYLRGYFSGLPPLRSIAQTVLVGGIAASAAFLLAKLVP